MSIRTLRYVSAAATGGGDGSSGNPWTIPEAVSNASATNVILVRPGTYLLTASVTIAGNSQLWVGVDGSDNPVGWWDAATLPVWDFQSGAYSVNISAKYSNMLYGIKVINASGHGFNINSDSYPNNLINCVADNCGSSAFLMGNYGRAFFCNALNSNIGFQLGGNPALAYKCISKDNTTNFYITSNGLVLGSASVDTSSNVVTHCDTASGYVSIVDISIHGSGGAGTTGISIAATGESVVLNNLIDAVETGISVGARNLLANNSVYGATTAYSLGTNNYEINDLTTDPQFTAPEALDFSIGEAAFQRHFAQLNLNLGADQSGGAGGGGSVFGSLIQVRG